VTRLLTALASWLSTHEYIAVWAEGIALVAIFIWDRLDSRAAHRQTIDQLKIAQASAESVINSERAWIMGDMILYEGTTLPIAELTDGKGTDETAVRVKLRCTNEGKSPAWIDNVYAHLEIASELAKLSSPPKLDGGITLGPMGSVGAGKHREEVLNLTCPGHLKRAEFLSVYVKVVYRDIFGTRRETHLGYSLPTLGINYEIHRQDALPERNRNT
jgi:hypothetical protein